VNRDSPTNLRNHPAVLAAIAFSSLLSGESAAGEAETVIRALGVSAPPQLDGVLDESFWKDAAVFDRFIQQVPEEGRPATERTEVRVVYTRDQLYFGVRCSESAPGGIIADELLRDQGRLHVRNDTFSIILDPFDDRRTGYLFIFNPLGARSDYASTDEGVSINQDWDPVWSVATRIEADGWSAEVEIPFKSLRYPRKRARWGINFRRVILRKNEWDYATAIPPAYSTAGILKLSSAAAFEGLEEITESRNLELKPYALARSQAEVEEEVVPREGFQPGLDVKYGFTPNLNLDLTWNTDFSDVELDEQQINLTRFGLFFPEKRTFFQEGRGIFDFGVGTGDYRVLPFFSRRIGLEEGRPVPIRGGGRLTGKIGPYSLGLLGLVTEEQDPYPATSFSVVRLKRDVLSRSSLGLIWTDRRPAATTPSSQTVGFDANLAFFSKSKVDLFWARTSPVAPGAGSDAHRAHLLLESDLLAFETEWMRVGEAFEPGVGFVQREDFDRRFGRFQISPRPHRLRMRKVFLSSSLDYVLNLRGQLATRNLESAFKVEFESADLLSFVWESSYEALERPFLVAGVLPVGAGRYRFDRWGLALESAQSRSLSASVSFSRGGFFDGSRQDAAATSILKVNAHLFFNLNYSTSDLDLMAGRLRTHLLSLRTNVALNTRLFGSALLQWNSLIQELGLNLRLRYSYRPGSDFFIVFNQRMARPGEDWRLRQRSLVLKWTYLLRL